MSNDQDVPTPESIAADALAIVERLGPEIEALYKEHQKWTPLQRAKPVVNPDAPIPLVPGSLPRGHEIWMNDRYTVIKAPTRYGNLGPMIHLSIRRIDRLPIRDWSDFQMIKNQLCGKDWEGVELYPRESRKVDEANQYHLWCFERWEIPVGFSGDRLVADGRPSNHPHGSKQRLKYEDPDVTPPTLGSLSLEGQDT